MLIIYFLYQTKLKANRLLASRIDEALKKQSNQQQIIVHQASLSSLGELAAGIAHEINQPLQNIAFITENLYLENKGNSELENDTKDILDDVDRIRKIIDHIRVFSRDQKDETQKEFNINESIQNAFSLSRHLYEKNRIQIDFDLNENIKNAWGNPFKYEQVVLNLLTNAKDAFEEKQNLDFEKKIKIRSFMNNSNVILEVQDNGIGIENENIEKIFHPFYTSKEIGKGTGLGLSISYGIIKEMNGSIEVTSEPEVGTKFAVSIPAIK